MKLILIFFSHIGRLHRVVANDFLPQGTTLLINLINYKTTLLIYLFYFKRFKQEASKQV